MGTVGVLTSALVVALTFTAPFTAVIARFIDQAVWISFVGTLTARKIKVYQRDDSLSIVDKILAKKTDAEYQNA